MSVPTWIIYLLIKFVLVSSYGDTSSLCFCLCVHLLFGCVQSTTYQPPSTNETRYSVMRHKHINTYKAANCQLLWWKMASTPMLILSVCCDFFWRAWVICDMTATLHLTLRKYLNLYAIRLKKKIYIYIHPMHLSVLISNRSVAEQIQGN